MNRVPEETGQGEAEPGAFQRWQQELLDFCPDAIIIRDPRDRIIYWNRGAQKLYGWDAEEVLGRLLIDVTSRDRALYDSAQLTLQSAGEWIGELPERNRDGAELVVSNRWRLVSGNDGKNEAILTINNDLTGQKTMEAHSLRAQRLESIGTLAGGVAHDLNNILTPIIMAAPMLRDDLPADAREMIVSTIEQSAERGAQMVKQVLTFARGLEGARVLVQVRHLIKEVAQIARDTFPKEITITNEAASQDLWPVLGDATQLHQVLLNLSVNARDAMPEGGDLTLRAVNMEIDENYVSMSAGSRAGKHVILEVTDTGCGIRREMQERIFDPFFTTKEIGKGTGLGLSTVVGIVKSHGGFVTVASELGRGTTFRVHLPAAEATAEAAASPESEVIPGGQGELILVVDDELGICRVTASILRSNGYRVKTAGDGTEALAVFAQSHGAVRVVITDLIMPFMDGVTLARTLKRMDPRVAIVVSTGQGDEHKLETLRSLHVEATLKKPYNKEFLLGTLRQVLHGDPAVPEA